MIELSVVELNILHLKSNTSTSNFIAFIHWDMIEIDIFE